MPNDSRPHDTWRVIDVLGWTRGFFQSRGIEPARLEAEVLLAHVLGMKRVMLYARFDQPLSTEERDRYRELVRRRAAHEPVAYLVGHREFWSLRIDVEPGVLIPRPDSELLVQLALDRLPHREVQVADVGTGSGALALALASERRDARVWATDTSETAVGVAAANARRLGLDDRVHVALGDLLQGVDSTVRLDLIVANLPYIPTAQIEELMSEVRKHEPREALDGGADGLALIERLVAHAPERLTDDGWLMLEAGADDVPRLRRRLMDAGWRDVEAHSDLAGRLRAVVARSPGTGRSAPGTP